MEATAVAPQETRITKSVRIDKPSSLRLGGQSETLLIPHSNPQRGLLIAYQDKGKHPSTWNAIERTGNTSIGRDETDVLFTDGNVSRRHLNILQSTTNGAYFAQDQQSMNGTFNLETTPMTPGRTRLYNKGWAYTDIAQNPTVHFGSATGRVEQTAEGIFFWVGGQKTAISEGVPISIGEESQNSIVLKNPQPG